MRYAADHKDQTREKLLESSGAIAKHGGFSASGVAGLMKAIGLTGGAFYSHFSSKDELFAAIVRRELSHSLKLLGGTRAGGADVNRAKLRRCLARYLSMAHVRRPDSGCAIPSLGAEIARAEPAVREEAERWLLQLQEAWSEVLGDPQLAWALIAQCVGALVLARMMASAQCQEEVLAASRGLVEKTLG